MNNSQVLGPLISHLGPAWKCTHFSLIRRVLLYALAISLVAVVLTETNSEINNRSFRSATCCSIFLLYFFEWRQALRSSSGKRYLNSPSRRQGGINISTKQVGKRRRSFPCRCRCHWFTAPVGGYNVRVSACVCVTG